MSEFTSTTDPDLPIAGERVGAANVPPIRATDGERLMRFWRHRDEAAFAEVVEIHAALVWGVCSHVLRHRQDIEDAFQATFLILARKAKSIRAADSAAGWLYRVAFRTALLARQRRARRTEQPLVNEPASDDDQLEAIARSEQCRLLLEELHALPMQYRQPLVLCYLEGRSRSEAADELGVTLQSVKGRLARGTRMLRSRLVSRGAALSTTMAVMSASMATAQTGVAPALISKTAALGASFALKLSAAGAKATAAKSGATILAEKGVLAMTIVAAAKPAIGVLGVCLFAGMMAVATAETPQGGAGGAPVVLLAADDNPDGGNDDAVSVDAEVAVVAAVDGEVAVAPPSEQLIIPAVEASAASSPAAPAPATPSRAATLAFAAAGAPPATAPYEMGWEGSLNFRLPDPAEPLPMFTSELTPARATGTSEASLKLEAEYWAIKARAFKMKADALKANAQKLKKLSETGQVTEAQSLEAEAEAELTMAEVKLCELNGLRVKEALEALESAEVDKLKLGSKGVKVRMLQQMLNERLQPSPKLDVDGDFGSLTKEAVKIFQKAHGLSPDGVVDAKIWAAIGSQELESQAAEAHAAQLLKPNFALKEHAEMMRKAQTVQAKAKKAAAAARASSPRPAEQPAPAPRPKLRIERKATGWTMPSGEPANKMRGTAPKTSQSAPNDALGEVLEQWRAEIAAARETGDHLVKERENAFRSIYFELRDLLEPDVPSDLSASDPTDAKYERLLKLQELKKLHDQLGVDIGGIEHEIMREKEQLREAETSRTR